MDYCNIKLLFDIKEVTQMEKVSKESVDARRNESRDESYDEGEADNANNKEATPEVLEKGDIFFFYRPKAKIGDDRSNGDVKGIEDISGFLWLLPLPLLLPPTLQMSSNNLIRQIKEHKKKKDHGIGFL